MRRVSPYRLVLNLSLGLYEKIVLIALFDFSDQNHTCFPSHATLAKICSISDKTVRRTIKNLSDNGFIKIVKKEAEQGRFIFNSYIINVHLLITSYRQNMYQGGGLGDQGGGLGDQGGGLGDQGGGLGDRLSNNTLTSLDLNNLLDLNINKKEKENKTKEKEKKLNATTQNYKEKKLFPALKSDRKKEIYEVFNFWSEMMKIEKPKLGHARATIIGRALEMYQVCDIKSAILGCRASEWHMGVGGEGQKIINLKTILRDEEQIEKFMAININPSLGRNRNGRRIYNSDIGEIERVFARGSEHFDTANDIDQNEFSPFYKRPTTSKD